MLNNHIHDKDFLIIPFQMYNLFCYNCFTAASLSPVKNELKPRALSELHAFSSKEIHDQFVSSVYVVLGM